MSRDIQSWISETGGLDSDSVSSSTLPLDSLLAAAIFDYISFVQQDQGEETPAASASPESMDHLRLERLVVDLVSSSVEDGYVSVSCP